MKTTLTVIVLLVERFEPPQKWTLEIPSEITSREEAADYVFGISNAPAEFLSETQREIRANYPRSGLRSVSVGDVIIIEDAEIKDVRHIATVERMGFNFH
jgi:hypothetical protein